MTKSIISVKNLSYSINQKQILSNVSFDVPEGSIYGFLGPNGAGKSTTIRLLLNLYHTEDEKLKIFGKSYQNDRINILKNIGALIEAPSLYSHLTGRQNLEVTRRLLGSRKQNITNALEVGYSGSIGHLFRFLSDTPIAPVQVELV